MHANGHANVLNVIRLNAVTKAFIDPLKSTSHHVTERDRNGNEETSPSPSISEGEPRKEPEEETFQSPKNVSKNSAWNGGRIPMEFARLYRLYLPFSCTYFPRQALLSA